MTISPFVWIVIGGMFTLGVPIIECIFHGKRR